MFRDILGDVDFSDYYSLRRAKRNLVSYLNAYDVCKRFSMLKLPPPSDVKEKLDKLSRNK